MKKTIFFLFMLCVLFSFAVSAQDFEERGTKGVLLNWDFWCNDFFLWCSSFENKIYECHGYEYGCGYDYRIAYGSVKVAGGYAYFGILESAPGWDNGGESANSIFINLSTWTGLGEFFWFYQSGGAMSGHGTNNNVVSLSIGPDPGTRSPVDQDSTGR